MHLKKAVGFGGLFWVFTFVIISALMFLPPLKDMNLAIFGIYWVLMIPLVLVLSRWYFTKEIATAKTGFVLGIVALIVGSGLDAVITVPFFVKSYSAFFGNWLMYVGYAELIILCILAGAEIDNFGKETSIDKK